MCLWKNEEKKNLFSYMKGSTGEVYIMHSNCNQCREHVQNRAKLLPTFEY